MKNNISPYQNESAIYFQTDFMATSLNVRKLFKKSYYLNPHKCLEGDVLANLRLGSRRLLFSNPYRSTLSRSLYDACREEKLPFLIVERGALPNSVFLDETGFLGDGSNYDEALWTSKKDDEARLWLRDFTADYHAGQQTLEPQSDSKGNSSPFSNVDMRRVVTIILQMQSDTVTQYFTESDRNYSAFLSFCKKIVAEESSNFRFIAKPHPRDPDIGISGAEDGSVFHIDDLLNSSDAVFTFNSGVGILAMLHGKRLGIFGDAYYGHKSLCYRIEDIADFRAFLRSEPDRSARAKFLHHLINSYYSTARFVTMPLGNRRTIAMCLTRLVIRRGDQITIIYREPQIFLSIIDAFRRALLNRMRRMVEPASHEV